MLLLLEPAQQRSFPITISFKATRIKISEQPTGAVVEQVETVHEHMRDSLDVALPATHIAQGGLARKVHHDGLQIVAQQSEAWAVDAPHLVGLVAIQQGTWVGSAKELTTALPLDPPGSPSTYSHR